MEHAHCSATPLSIGADLLRHPFTCIISGASMSGKTVFILKLIKERHTMIFPQVQRVIYSYKKYQSVFNDVQNVNFVKGDSYQLDRNISTLLIIDDQLQDMSDQRLAELFTVNCHHDNTSVIFVTQNLFFQNKAYRTACLNAQYLILFRSPRGSSQVAQLARQLATGKGESKKICDAYEDATSSPFSYLLMDLKPDTPRSLRYRTHILNGEGLPFKRGDKSEDANPLLFLTRCYAL